MTFFMIGGVVVVLAIAAVLLFGVFGAGGLQRRDQRVKDQAKAFDESPGAGTLHYRVPGGQDPAAVMAALEREGYPATLDMGSQEVLVPCPRGTEHERDHVRAVIARAALNLEGDPAPVPVVFEDER